MAFTIGIHYEAKGVGKGKVFFLRPAFGTEFNRTGITSLMFMAAEMISMVAAFAGVCQKI